MKKLFIICLTLTVLISLSGCGTSYNTGSEKTVKAAGIQNKTTKEENQNRNQVVSNTVSTPKTEVATVQANNTVASEAPKEQTQVKLETAQLDSKYNEWYNTRNSSHTTPGIPANMQQWLSKYNGIFTGDTSKKVFYFTFDAGGDTGYANQILDVLNKQGIKATFFMTKPYITQNPSIVQRIVNEGHAVGNHTVNHLALPKLSDEQIKQELGGTEEEFTRVTGKSMLKYMRPPMGAYSEKSLYITQQLGYKTVFWSIAYNDYDVKNQPSHDEAMSIIKNNYHNGAIILLHMASKTDADTLDEMISYLKANGYSFGKIDDI